MEHMPVPWSVWPTEWVSSDPAFLANGAFLFDQRGMFQDQLETWV